MGIVTSWILVCAALVAVRAQVLLPAGEYYTWCGKPYLYANHSMDPGGQFPFPSTTSTPDKLYLTILPRYTIFLDTDETGSFIIDASISQKFGQTYHASTPLNATNGTAYTFLFSVASPDIGFATPLVSGSVVVNTTSNLFNFSLAQFTPRLKPYTIIINGTTTDNQPFNANTEIYVLPSRSYGSAVKLDNLYGGMYIQNGHNNYTGWYVMYPFGGFADGNQVIPSTNGTNLTTLNTYIAQGNNFINIVPDGGTPDQSYTYDSLNQYWNRMDEANLFNVYNLQFAWRNATRITTQVEMFMNRSTLLMYYTADEPDGWSYPLNSTKLAYDLIKELDPYHPVNLVLNCQNFYYSDYTSGTDIVGADPYPIGIIGNYSTVWETAVNTTYGDCGCDNCIGVLKDVSDRIDDMRSYQADLGDGRVRKPTWLTIQAFGEQGYWARIPGISEVLLMMMLAVNHGSKGLSYWIYPSTDANNLGMGELAAILGVSPAVDFLFGTDPVVKLPVTGLDFVDASAWILGEKMMVSVGNLYYNASTAPVTIELPAIATGIEMELFGATGWTVSGNQMVKAGMVPLEIGLFILDLA